MGRLDLLAVPAALFLVLVAVACDPESAPAKQAGAVEKTRPAVADAGPGASDGSLAPPSVGTSPGQPPATRTRVNTPASEFHLDDSEATYRPRRRSATRRDRSTIHITLKSTPSGAMVAVDGVSVGRTPAFWEGEVTGKPHEFTFVLPGYAMARYRFVPTTHGIVHGTLKKLAAEPSDGGVPAEP